MSSILGSLLCFFKQKGKIINYQKLSLSRFEVLSLLSLLIVSFALFSKANELSMHMLRERITWMLGKDTSFLSIEPSPGTLAGHFICSVLNIPIEKATYILDFMPSVCLMFLMFYYIRDKFGSNTSFIIVYSIISSFEYNYHLINGVNEISCILFVCISLALFERNIIIPAVLIFVIAALFKITALFFIVPVVYFVLKYFLCRKELIVCLYVVIAAIGLFCILNYPLIMWWLENYKNYVNLSNYFDNLNKFGLSIIANYPLFALISYFSFLKLDRQFICYLFLFISVISLRSLLPWGGNTQHYYSLVPVVSLLLLSSKGINNLLSRYPKLNSTSFAAFCILFILGFNVLLKPTELLGSSEMGLSDPIFHQFEYTPTRSNTDIKYIDVLLRREEKINLVSLGNSGALVYYLDKNRIRTHFPLADEYLSDKKKLAEFIDANKINYVIGFENRSNLIEQTLYLSNFEKLGTTGPTRLRLAIYAKK